MKEQAQNRHKTWANEVHWWCLDLYLTVNLQRKSFILSPKCDFTTFWWWFPAFSWKSSSSVANLRLSARSTSSWIAKLNVRPAGELWSSWIPASWNPGWIVQLVWIPAGIQKVHLIFFHLLAVRPAQAHPGPYGPGCAGLTILFAFQAVRPEMHSEIQAVRPGFQKSISQPSVVRCVYFSFDQLFFFKRKVGINWSSP